MDYIRKMPLLMALTGAITIGMLGCAQKAPDKENLLRMFINMVIFYIVGFLIRSTINNILEANRIKAEEILQEQKRIENEKRKEEKIKKQADKIKGLALDLVADDDLDFASSDEDFDALPVADFIKKELNQ